MMRLLVTGGGTGGHVYPALSVLEAFDPPPDLLWVGTRGGLEAPLVERAGLPYRGITAGGLRDLPWLTRLRNSTRLLRGFGEAQRIVRDFRPDVVFATGGYVTFPVGLAAWLQRIPILIYLPDIVPGLAVRALAPLAREVAVTTSEAARWFGRKAIVTGYPVRRALVSPKSRAAARHTFGLPEDDKVLLVTGGSQGSHALNEAVGMFLPQFLEVAHVIHVHGKSDGEWLVRQRATLSAAQQARYQLYEYLHERMIDALLTADLVVARAGASVLGEFPVAELPAILVPLPIAGVNQEDNARWLAARGGAVVLPNDAARMGLLPLVRGLLSDDERLATMRAALRAVAQPGAAAAIAARLRHLATRTTQPTTQGAKGP